MAGWAPLQLPEPQRQGDQWRRPERHHAGPELVPQPEHEVAVQLQRDRPAFARVTGDADRTERRYDPGLRHATRHGLLSRPVDIEPADRNRRAHIILNVEADTWHLIPAPGGPMQGVGEPPVVFHGGQNPMTLKNGLRLLLVLSCL